MVTIRGVIRKGVIEPDEPLEGFEGQPVTIMVEDDLDDIDSIVVDENDTLGKIIAAHQVETGIGDLAHQHDHYLYGTPKR